MMYLHFAEEGQKLYIGSKQQCCMLWHFSDTGTFTVTLSIGTGILAQTITDITTT